MTALSTCALREKNKTTNTFFNSISQTKKRQLRRQQQQQTVCELKNKYHIWKIQSKDTLKKRNEMKETENASFPIAGRTNCGFRLWK